MRAKKARQYLLDDKMIESWNDSPSVKSNKNRDQTKAEIQASHSNFSRVNSTNQIQESQSNENNRRRKSERHQIMKTKSWKEIEKPTTIDDFVVPAAANVVANIISDRGDDSDDDDDDNED